jgi:hypothetical protein
VESSKVYGRDGEVGIKVDTLAALVGVQGAAGLVVPALVSNGNEMVRVDALDVGRSILNPSGQNTHATAVAARLVGYKCDEYGKVYKLGGQTYQAPKRGS